MVDCVRLEIVQNGHRHSSVGKRSQQGYAPLRRVAAHKGYAVALLYASGLESDMEFGYFACHGTILERLALEIGKRLALPVVAQRLRDIVDD